MKKFLTVISLIIALSGGPACPGGYRESENMINQLEEN
jgi:hypothetical protein